MTNKNKLEILKDLRDYTKALFIVDMNNGFVNFGNMANPKYNDLVPEQLKLINKFRTEEELVAFVLEAHKKNAVEFKTGDWRSAKPKYILKIQHVEFLIKISKKILEMLKI